MPKFIQFLTVTKAFHSLRIWRWHCCSWEWGDFSDETFHHICQDSLSLFLWCRCEGWRRQNGCQEIASDGLRCSSLLSVNHRKTAKATAPSTEGRCVTQSWPRMPWSFSTPPTRTLRRPRSCWSTLRGMSWRLWAHSAGRLPRLCCVTISSKSATQEWYLLPCPFAGKTLKMHKIFHSLYANRLQKKT